jgi:carbon monoxide dehydrogenase subunit G
MLEYRKTLDLAVPVARVWEVITDFPSYHAIVPEFKEAVVESRGEGTARVRFALALPVRTVSYRLDYTFAPPGRLSWTLAGSDLLKANEGEWILEEAGGRTRVTYVHRTEFPAWIAWAVGAAAYEREMEKTLQKFRDRIEGKTPDDAERIRRLVQE